MWNMFTSGWCSALSMALAANGDWVASSLCLAFAVVNYLWAGV